MDRHVKPLIASAFLVVALLGAPPAAAQAGASEDPEVLAEARRIFMEGLAHSDRQQWRQAVASFRQVLELRAAPPVLYNIAIALVEIGEYPEAQDLLEEALASDEITEPIRQGAEQLLAQIEGQSATVTIEYRGDDAGVVFFIDDYALGTRALGRSHFVKPGTHTVEARRGSSVLAREIVELEQGQSVETNLVAPDARVGREIAGAEALEREPRERESRPWVWVGVGVGVAVVVSVVLAVALSGTREREPHTGDLSPGRITF